MSMDRNRWAPALGCRRRLRWVCMRAVALYEQDPPDLPKPRRWRMSGGPPAFELRAWHDFEPGEERERPARDTASARLWRIAHGENRGFLRAVAREMKARGAPRLLLLTAKDNVTAQRLFAKVGFETTMLEMKLEL